jgi:hypothetical protein
MNELSEGYLMANAHTEVPAMKLRSKLAQTRSKVVPKPAAPLNLTNLLPLWQLDIGELAGHNLESHGREEVNRMLQEGWVLLHIYTLKYPEDGVWRERPMAILGKPRVGQKEIFQ